jgi:hypothetical protein
MKRLIPLLLCLLWGVSAHAAVIKTVQAGATDQTVVIKIIDSTDGTPETAVAFNTSGIDLEYWRHGANSVTDITEVTQTVSGAHTDGGFVSLGNGYYRLDLPDAAVASGATAVEVMGTVTGMIVIGGTVQLSPPMNVVSFGGTAVTGRDIGASVLLSSGTGTGQISLTSGIASVNTTQWGGTAVASATVNANATQISGDSGAADALETAFDGTAGAVSPLGIARQGTAQSATSTTLVMDSGASFADDAAIGMTVVACGSTQGYCQSRTVTDSTNSNDTLTVSTWTVTPSGTITYYLFATAPGSGATDVNVVTIEGADATTVLGTAQSGDAYSRLGAPAGASISADVAAVKSDSGAIKTKTDQLNFTVTGQVDSNVKSMNEVEVVGSGTEASPWNGAE